MIWSYCVNAFYCPNANTKVATCPDHLFNSVVSPKTHIHTTYTLSTSHATQGALTILDININMPQRRSAIIIWNHCCLPWPSACWEQGSYAWPSFPLFIHAEPLLSAALPSCPVGLKSSQASFRRVSCPSQTWLNLPSSVGECHTVRTSNQSQWDAKVQPSS